MEIAETIVHDKFIHMQNVRPRRRFNLLYAAVTFVVLWSGLLQGGPATQPSTVPSNNTLAADDFRGDLSLWSVETESGGSVTTRDGALDIDVPAGCTVWLKQRLDGPIMIEYEATAIDAGG